MSDSFPPPPPPPPPPNDYFGSSSRSATVVPCSNGVRFGAFMLDALLAIVTFGIGWLIWDIVLWQQSTSPAKKMLNLRIVDTKTGAPASMTQMLLREGLGKLVLGSITSGILWLVSAVLILADPTRKGVWDYLGTTTVVRDG